MPSELFPGLKDPTLLKIIDSSQLASGTYLATVSPYGFYVSGLASTLGKGV